MAKGDRTLSAESSVKSHARLVMSMLKFSLDLGLERETCSLSGFAGSKGLFFLKKKETKNERKGQNVRPSAF